MSRPALRNPPRYPPAVLGGVWAEELAANGAAAPTNRTCATTGYGRLGRLVPRPPTLAYARSAGWEGPCQISRPTARFSPETASRRETRTTHRPTSHGPLPLLFFSDRRRPYGLRYPTLWWPDRRDTGQPRAVECHFSWFLSVFSARRSPIAAASFAACRWAIMAFLCQWICCTRLPARRATG